MKCPTCAVAMTPHASVTPDLAKRMTTWMCPQCFKRILVTEPNQVLPEEVKMPRKVIVHNPHTKRGRVYTAAVETPKPGLDDLLEMGNGQ